MYDSFLGGFLVVFFCFLLQLLQIFVTFAAVDISEPDHAEEGGPRTGSRPAGLEAAVEGLPGTSEGLQPAQS